MDLATALTALAYTAVEWEAFVCGNTITSSLTQTRMLPLNRDKTPEQNNMPYCEENGHSLCHAVFIVAFVKWPLKDLLKL